VGCSYRLIIDEKIGFHALKTSIKIDAEVRPGKNGAQENIRGFKENGSMKSQLPPPEAAAPSATATGQALGCCTWKVLSCWLHKNILIIVILESIPLLLMSGYIFPYQVPAEPSSSVLTPYPQSEL
jgi:hypothetical protein